MIKAIWSTMNANVESNQITQIVKALVEHGADIDAKNDSGRSGNNKLNL